MVVISFYEFNLSLMSSHRVPTDIIDSRSLALAFIISPSLSVVIGMSLKNYSIDESPMRAINIRSPVVLPACGDKLTRGQNKREAKD